jgi:tetratricopeptide (TPR) repeat protein
MKITSRSAAVALFLTWLTLTVHAANDGAYQTAWQLARDRADQGTLATDRTKQKQLFLEAEKASRQAVRLQPDDSKGHAFLAIAVGKLALFEGGRRKVELSKEVQAEAEKALALNPNEDVACHTLAIWHREMVGLNWVLKKVAELLYGRFPPASLDEAIRLLRRAVNIAPNVVAHHVELGLTLAAAQQWPAAKTELDKALALPKAWVTDDYYREMAQKCLTANQRKF